MVENRIKNFSLYICIKIFNIDNFYFIDFINVIKFGLVSYSV